MKEIKNDIRLMIAKNVLAVDKKKKTLTLKLVYPSYLSSSQRDADKLLDSLIEQMTNYFSYIPIRGLELSWQQVDRVEEDVNTSNKE